MAMKPEVKAKWLTALRSGEYKRGAMALRKPPSEENGPARFCCLGVLCDLAKKEGMGDWEKIDSRFHFVDKNGESNPQYLPPAVRDWAGLESPDPTVIEGGYTDALSSLNDRGRNFLDIADLIERHL